ncbi:MAG: hypothetical protein JOS17DRAFT_70469 [Linnemannia elongata]|nr:MAG: hypothetical protein JOS17DRAFT_70469 [Linnemannia elongata]
MHSSRSLSVLGRATIINTLILSRLWHLAWDPFPYVAFIQSQTGHYKIRLPLKPTASWTVIITPPPPQHNGGLGAIDPLRQQQTLHIKHLRNATVTILFLGKDILLAFLINEFLSFSFVCLFHCTFLVDRSCGIDAFVRFAVVHPVLRLSFVVYRSTFLLPPLSQTLQLCLAYIIIPSLFCTSP